MSSKVNIGVPKNIATNTTTLVKTGSGVLYSMTVNTTAAGHIHIYDGLTAGGTLLATLASNTAVGQYKYDCTFRTGLCVVTDAASDITIVYE